MLDALIAFLRPWLPWMAAGSLGSLLLVAVAVPLIVVELPAGYFARAERGELRGWARHPLVRWPLRVLKNVFALVLIALGLLMLVLPGQGLLTIAVGVLLLDFPGKYRLERRVVCRPGVLRVFNRIRARAGKPPFEVAADG